MKPVHYLSISSLSWTPEGFDFREREIKKCTIGIVRYDFYPIGTFRKYFLTGFGYQNDDDELPFEFLALSERLLLSRK